MKTSPLNAAAVACAASLVLVTSNSATAFAPISPNYMSTATATTATTASTTLSMFSGSSLDVEEEEDDEKRSQIEQMAKAMGMSVEEYQLGMNARGRMENAINDLRVESGNAATVLVERDGNMPPKFLKVTVTTAGKALGKAALEKEIVGALKGASEQSTKGRDDAQADMMKYISESYKKIGS